MFSSKSGPGQPGIDRDLSHELRDGLLVSGAQRMSSVARGCEPLNLRGGSAVRTGLVFHDFDEKYFCHKPLRDEIYRAGVFFSDPAGPCVFSRGSNIDFEGI